mmetsp:Transcript_9811/g.9734  ORF Transcript_9811/g.9734 Transcript_9811/m.9734 type:complete len:385 (+) Transcript_9811:624-1778(+)|eukprot:CAMPEP_0202943914 /NCGR_PEP_ID=MMETSP1395-20130829/4531_1 /ASSEMBLY_ACC=CAM_ASM_000871 /TAXON_ID=5961 /ORGANISM="Blepharisma japonicum, Strain Stock R1072" /LENGTH=384 /DNA_ID=CAMNT_0049642019 /DNA_START=601 /DNA_END=1755 /DNA_ORIENTATION=+
MSYREFLQGYEKETNQIDDLKEAIEYHLSLGDFNTASTVLCQLVTLDGYNAAEWANLGHCYLLLERLDESFRAYSNAHLIWKDSAPAQLWYGLGLLCFKCRLFEMAERYFQAALRADPKFEHTSHIYLKLGIINKKSKQYLKAITYLRNCLNTQDLSEEQTIETLCQIANCLEVSRKSYAIELYQVARNLKSNLKTTACLGWGYFVNKDYDKAIAMFNEALSLAENPETKPYCDVVYLKARCLIETKSFHRALSLLTSITSKYPQEPIYKMSLAVVYVELEQCQNALACLYSCLTLKYDEIEAYINLGIVNELMFQREEAIAWYQKVIDKNPANNIAPKRFKLLSKHKNKPRNIPEPLQPNIDITEFPFKHIEWNYQQTAYPQN